MTDQLDCLICGRSTRPTGEPDCDCLTHSLSLPVEPPQYGPDPADVALFDGAPGDEPGDPFGRTFRVGRSHRKPRQRAKLAMAAGGAVAAVVGCTALAASFLGGHSRPEDGRSDPSLSLPDHLLPREREHGTVPRREATAEAGGNGQQAGDHDGSAPGGSGDSDGTGDVPDSRPSPLPPSSADPDRDPPSAGPSRPRPSAPQPSEPQPSEPQPAESGASEDSSSSGTEEPPPSWPEAAPSDTGSLLLQEGDHGSEVSELQQRLAQLSWYEGSGPHGRFDQETREAVLSFQLSQGLLADPMGVYGDDTREALEGVTVDP